MKTLPELIICILIIVLTGCNKESTNPIDNSDTINTNGVVDTFTNFVINYRYYSNWVGYNYSADINQDGFMEVNEVSELHAIYRKISFELTNADIEDIFEKLTLLTAIEMDDSYGFGPEKPTDLPITSLKYITDVSKDSTLIYAPDEDEMPKTISNLLFNVVSVINKMDTARFYH
ncbi:MAG: hypothetical protein JXB49_01525 [Bacteroidales bacterium]|nr:hypothetical protein [Bacteroidales bacterium]